MGARFQDLADGQSFYFNGYCWRKSGQQAACDLLRGLYAFLPSDFVTPAR